MSADDRVFTFVSSLEASGHITAESAQRILSARRQTGQAVDVIIRELGILAENSIASELALSVRCEFLQKPILSDDNNLIGLLGLDFIADKHVIPVQLTEAGVSLIVADPFDTETVAAVSFFFDKPVIPLISTRSAIEEAVSLVRQNTVNDDAPGRRGEANEFDLERLQDVARDAPVVKFVSRIIQKAVDAKATDIHIEPQAEVIRVRLRQDGILINSEAAPITLHAGIVSRLKILSRLNIAERRLPQDGRIRLPVRGSDVDFRLSIVPSVHGESAVLRILDRDTVRLDLSALGYDDAAAEKVRSITQRPNGIFLVTGPTGSGKTTTLYAILAELNRTDVKIFTVEDPVEYRMAGITQLQIDPAIGLTFASALRSVLRQDPDIILVGEIRDRETAEIAIQAALTGHLVLSTLHTNSAIGAFNRLRDMGVEPFLLEATMRGVIGQRLVRQLCPTCLASGSGICQVCGGTGYKGRRATYEILEVTDGIRQAIVKSDTEEQLKNLAEQGGMVSLRDHAHGLAQRGLTTKAEVRRVVETENIP